MITGAVLLEGISAILPDHGYNDKIFPKSQAIKKRGKPNGLPLFPIAVYLFKALWSLAATAAICARVTGSFGLNSVLLTPTIRPCLTQ